MPRSALGCLVALALGAAVVVASPARAAPGPAVEVPEAELRAALECPDPMDDPARDPLLLVHGTFTNPWEHWSWNWQKAKTAAGWDVCTVELPNRSLGDMQVQAEYVVFAIREIAARSGDSVDVMGHSQGALHPRWALKWWPDVGSLVDDLVMLAGPNHGTALAAKSPPSGCFPSCWQMTTGSNYLAALNAGDETPGAVSYTSVYTLFDELVQPQAPVSTSALDGASNVLVQDVCPERPVEHAFMMADHTVHAIVMDALDHAGPADPGRIDPLAACAGAFFDGVDLGSEPITILERSIARGFPEWESTPAEPPLKPYAREAGAAAPAPADAGTVGSDGSGGDGAGVEAAGVVARPGPVGEVTPATGGNLSLAASALAAPLALRALLRRRRARPGG